MTPFIFSFFKVLVVTMQEGFSQLEQEVRKVGRFVAF